MCVYVYARVCVCVCVCVCVRACVMAMYVIPEFCIKLCAYSTAILQGGSRLVLSIHVDQVLFLPTTNWLTNTSSNADVSTAGLQSSSG